MNIHQSFAIGNTGERFVLQEFSSKNIQAVKYDGINKQSHDLDCVLGKKKFKVEVKYDVMAQKTDNIAIEFYNIKQKKPSGIDATKANIWAHVLADGSNLTLWLASVKGFKAFIKTNKPFRTIECAGDDNASLYLYRTDNVLDVILHRAETLDKDNLHKLIRKLLR